MVVRGLGKRQTVLQMRFGGALGLEPATVAEGIASRKVVDGVVVDGVVILGKAHLI